EFGMVYDLLFGKSTTPGNQRQALSYIRIWSLRRGTLCPASVLATAVLVQAQLEDKQGNPNIQTTYASAFTRFFNFMSSIMQHGFTVTSMYETARQLGLPSFIVDLRHLCAHGQELPPAVMLRNTAQHCMEWLRTFYWLPQQETMTDIDAPKLQPNEKAQFEKELGLLLDIYDLALDCLLNGAEKLKKVRKFKSSAEFNKLRLFCSIYKIKSIAKVLDKVINELSIVVKRHNTAMKDLVDTYMAAILKMKYFLGAGLKHVEDEDMLIHYTQDLFRLLALQGYIENAFVAFIYLAENSNANTETRKGAGYWATKMLQTFGMLRRIKNMYCEELEINPTTTKKVDFSRYNLPNITKLMKTLLIHSGVDPTLTIIFGDCPKKPHSWVFDQEFLMNRVGNLSEFSMSIFKGLMPLVNPPFSKEQSDDLNKFCQMQLEKLNGQESVQENPPLEDVQQTEEEQVEKSESKTYGNWTLDEGSLVYYLFTFNRLILFVLHADKRWSTCALGVVPSSC
ncbi:hypothetical protein KR093_006710, partial [Drosophila rubida]